MTAGAWASPGRFRGTATHFSTQFPTPFPIPTQGGEEDPPATRSERIAEARAGLFRVCVNFVTRSGR